jgi:VanZ family protein
MQIEDQMSETQCASRAEWMQIMIKRLITIVNNSLPILWMVVIYTFSAQPLNQTSQLSMSLAKKMQGSTAAGNIDVDAAAINLSLLNSILRESAHFFLFFVLGLLVINAVRRIWSKQRSAYYLSAAICLIYALFDEVHQIFVRGRDSDVSDIMIDFNGAVIGIVIYWMIYKMLLKKHVN